MVSRGVLSLLQIMILQDRRDRRDRTMCTNWVTALDPLLNTSTCHPRGPGPPIQLSDMIVRSRRQGRDWRERILHGLPSTLQVLRLAMRCSIAEIRSIVSLSTDLWRDGILIPETCAADWIFNMFAIPLQWVCCFEARPGKFRYLENKYVVDIFKYPKASHECMYFQGYCPTHWLPP